MTQTCVQETGCGTASASIDMQLPRFILQLSEAGPVRLFSGRAAAPLLGPAFDRLLARRVIIEHPPLDEVAPGLHCDLDCPARLVQEARGRLWAACPYGACAREEVSPLGLRSFELQLEEFCRCVREDNGWRGEPVARLADGLWTLGRSDGRAGEARLMLLAFRLREADTTATQLLARGVANGDPVTLLTPTENRLSLPARQIFNDAGIPLVSIAEALSGKADGAPFHLEPARLSGARPQDPRLVLEVATRTATFEGTDLNLAPQPFDLLLFLARHALQSGSPVQRRDIEDALWGNAPTGHHLSDVVRRLREAFATAGVRDPSAVIQNQPRFGYRLGLTPEDIKVIPKP